MLSAPAPRSVRPCSATRPLTDPAEHPVLFPPHSSPFAGSAIIPARQMQRAVNHVAHDLLALAHTETPGGLPRRLRRHHDFPLDRVAGALPEVEAEHVRR